MMVAADNVGQPGENFRKVRCQTDKTDKLPCVDFVSYLSDHSKNYDAANCTLTGWSVHVEWLLEYR